MSASDHTKDDRPGDPTDPILPTEHQQTQDAKLGSESMCSRIQSENDVAAIQLSGGKQIQRGGQHSYPGGNRSRSQVEWRAEFGRGRVNSQNREGPAHHTEDQRQSQNRPALAGLSPQRLGGVKAHPPNSPTPDQSPPHPPNPHLQKNFT